MIKKLHGKCHDCIHLGVCLDWKELWKKCNGYDCSVDRCLHYKSKTEVIELRRLRLFIEALEKKIDNPYGCGVLTGAENKRTVSIDILKYAFRDRKDDDNGD